MKKYTSDFQRTDGLASFFSQDQAYKRFILKKGALSIGKDRSAGRAKNIDSGDGEGFSLFPKKIHARYILHKALQWSLKVQACVSAKFKNRALAATAAVTGIAKTIDVSYHLK